MLTKADLNIVQELKDKLLAHDGKRIRRISDLVQIKLADITTITEETVAGVRIIKSFATENHEIRRFSAENERAYDTVIKGEKKRAQLRPIIEFLGAFGIALVLWLGGNEVARNTELRALPPDEALARIAAGTLAVLRAGGW